ncbi:MAG: 3-deoxy-D-manno-octulosonic-acid transferase [Saprospiraceae bacterium]|jgi:3-deoxy-D-manno-octulosonic-acid transferase
MQWLYNIAIQCYVLGVRLASLFNPKAKQWLDGRKEVFKNLETAGFKASDAVVWIHAASLGEFEQGRPIIEQLKKEYPHCKILLTFFSPSGYEIRKDYKLADYVSYLPMDSKSNAQRFIEIVQPKLAIFIKYELWYHFLQQLQKAKIPTLLVSALFRKEQFYFKNYGSWFKPVLAGLYHIFVQNKNSEQVLLQQGISKVSLIGDTRIDRVIKIREEKKSFPIVEAFVKNKPVLICGSTWPPDEGIIQDYINNNPKKWRYIIAPHVISPSRIAYIENIFQIPHIRYSESEGARLDDYDLLIIDNIGMLSSLYQYGKVAYIGGAFGKGLHNTLEPITFGLPVIFGSNYQKFEEATYLVENGGGFSVDSSNAFETTLNQLEEESTYCTSSKTAAFYISNNKGATQEIINFIAANKLLLSAGK